MNWSSRFMQHSDARSVNKLLKGSNNISINKSSMKVVLDHISNDHGFAAVLVDDDTQEIVGVWCSLEFKNYISLSFFYTVEYVRRKSVILSFFKECYELSNSENKPLFIKTKDPSSFAKYVKPVPGEPDVYQFVGLGNRNG